MNSPQQRWLDRRTGFVQGRLTAAGYELGLESEMPPEAQEQVRQALAEFEALWPRELQPWAPAPGVS
jgi:hypothetical protein